jgi:GH24 family phage-related lysozyme (muramidase)
MTASDKAIALIKQWEGCKLEAYTDSAGIWTVGYGTTGPGIQEGTTISQRTAEGMLLDRVQTLVYLISDYVKPILTQNQFDALVSLVYNIGITAFKGSTLLRCINLRQWSQAAGEILRWDHVGALESEGLKARRKAESALFMS